MRSEYDGAVISLPKTPPSRAPFLFACSLLLSCLPGLAESRDAPFQLSASDGSGLALVRLDARGVLEGPLAFTELHLSFENPQPRTIEGRFTLILPPNATISRFARPTPTTSISTSTTAKEVTPITASASCPRAAGSTTT